MYVKENIVPYAKSFLVPPDSFQWHRLTEIMCYKLEKLKGAKKIASRHCLLTTDVPIRLQYTGSMIQIYSWLPLVNLHKITLVWGCQKWSSMIKWYFLVGKYSMHPINWSCIKWWRLTVDNPLLHGNLWSL